MRKGSEILITEHSRTLLKRVTDELEQMFLAGNIFPGDMTEQEFHLHRLVLCEEPEIPPRARMLIGVLNKLLFQTHTPHTPRSIMELIEVAREFVALTEPPVPKTPRHPKHQMLTLGISGNGKRTPQNATA
jgi:hypothetical protein